MKSYSFIINGQKFKTNIKEVLPGKRIIQVNGVDYEIEVEGEKEAIESRQNAVKNLGQTSAAATNLGGGAPQQVASPNDVLSPIPGLIIDILVKEGDKVANGDIILKMEAMKMENEIRATKSGVVKKIHVSKSDSVLEGQPLVSIE